MVLTKSRPTVVHFIILKFSTNDVPLVCLLLVRERPFLFCHQKSQTFFQGCYWKYNLGAGQHGKMTKVYIL